MKRTTSKTRRRKYPRRQAPQKDAGTLIARRAIVRALRKEGMQRVLKGTMATVGFVMPDTIVGSGSITQPWTFSEISVRSATSTT